MAYKDLTQVRYHVFLCNGNSCLRQAGEDVVQNLRSRISELGLQESAHTTRTRCNGRCEDGPIVIVEPGGVWYKKVTPELARRIVDCHLRDDTHVENEVLYKREENILKPALLCD